MKKVRVTRYETRKESLDLSMRDCLIASLDNRERALRYSFTHIPYLALSRHSRIEERGTWNLLSQRAQVANGNGALKTMVASNPYAIGYISLGTVDNTVNALAIDGVDATVANVKNGSYKVARPFLVLYKEGKPSAETQKFLDWMLTEDAQKLVDQNGYISVH